MHRHPHQDPCHDDTAVEIQKKKALQWIEEMKDKEDGALVVSIIMQQLREIKKILHDIVEKHKIYMEQMQKQLQEQDERLQKYEKQHQQKEEQQQKLQQFLDNTMQKKLNPKPRHGI